MNRRLLPGLVAAIAAQPVLAMNLIETYEKALTYDSGIAEARATLQAEQASIDISRADLLPRVNAFGDARHTDTDPDNASGDSYKTFSYGVELTQPLFRADAWFGFETSQIRSEAARAQYNLAQQQLILDVAEGYFNVLRAADALTTAQATEMAIRRQYDQAQERFDVGLIAITEVYEARASYDDSKSQRIAAESDLAIAREELARLTGEYTEQLDNLRQEFPLARPTPMNPTDWEQIALGQNWEIQTALLELDASKSTLESRKAGHYPALDLNASYGVTDISGLGPGGTGSTAGSGGATRSGNGATTEGVISLTLNVPLYLGGGIQAGVRQQRSLVTVADQALNTVRRDVRVNTRSLFRQVNTNIESASALEQTIISRRSALDATRAGYDVGTRNIVEVLDAEQDYYEALQNYANARYDYVLNTLNLKQSAGTLSPQDLMDLNRWLSASAPGIEALAEDDETIDDPTEN
ncbi:TolC family outer membrane protein [Marinobacter sp. ATCH36]|uniref:TolC family outer membrane protein n=1 Tax=Marinobacter sp. ATCH36 TaxID=2945106 RepID=UPI00202259BE|nr:TolC family outer membrane protein [Marinobacter sp. ATCH36]MCL7944035.1 TolC family outer membrane protein [Marinobacter sp. ATCH36]